MIVYKLTGFGNYCAGTAIIVAPNVEVARGLGKTILSSGCWNIDYSTGDIEELDLKDSGPERVVTNFEFGE